MTSIEPTAPLLPRYGLGLRAPSVAGVNFDIVVPGILLGALERFLEVHMWRAPDRCTARLDGDVVFIEDADGHAALSMPRETYDAFVREEGAGT